MGKEINKEAIQMAQAHSLENGLEAMNVKSGLGARDEKSAEQLIAAKIVGEVQAKSALGQKILRSLTQDEKLAYILKPDTEKATFRMTWAEKDCDICNMCWWYI